MYNNNNLVVITANFEIKCQTFNHLSLFLNNYPIKVILLETQLCHLNTVIFSLNKPMYIMKKSAQAFA